LVVDPDIETAKSLALSHVRESVAQARARHLSFAPGQDLVYSAKRGAVKSKGARAELWIAMEAEATGQTEAEVERSILEALKRSDAFLLETERRFLMLKTAIKEWTGTVEELEFLLYLTRAELEAL
jgi:hypothetical protein